MSMNYAFGFSLFLLILVAMNIYFFYSLITIKPQSSNYNSEHKFDPKPNVFKEIFKHLDHLPNHYKVKNPKFVNFQRSLVHSFNTKDVSNTKSIWHEIEKWNSDDSLLPHANGSSAQLLHAIKSSQIVLVDNAPKGTQLKLLLLLQGKQKLYFKPKRYNLDHVIKGSIYSGYDRHNSEVFAYYLAMVMNFKWIPPSTIRRIHIDKDILPVATLGLRKTMLKNDNGSICIYGKCFYCRANTTVCPDNNGEIEGAAIFYLEKPFKVYKSPWCRSYSRRKMEWEEDNDYCKKIQGNMNIKRILNLVDVAIFDFLMQNGDRHRYEVFKGRIVLLDNGKGLGTPSVDELTILAPLYQCCVVSMSTWQHLELLSGGNLIETMKVLISFQGDILATEEHFEAVERRLLIIYATVQYCVGKHGIAKVFKHSSV